MKLGRPSGVEIGVTLLALVASFAFLELLVRSIPSAAPPDPVVPAELKRFDELLGWSNRPLARAVSTRTGRPVEYRINSKGLRDDETPYEKPAGRFRIVLIGDSRTFGFGVPIEQHFSKLLEEQLDVEVVNLGVGAYGIDQELLALRAEGFRYEPDLVIAYIAHYGAHRHMHSVRFGAAKPRFDLIRGELRLVGLDHRQVTVHGSGWLRAVDAALSRSVALSLVRQRLVGIGVGSDDPVAEPAGNAANDLDPAFVARLHAVGERIVRAMRDESAAHGSGFVLVTEIDRLHVAAGAAGIVSLNVAAALDNPDFALPDGLAHLNDRGNEVLAGEVARFLKQGGLVPDE